MKKILILIYILISSSLFSINNDLSIIGMKKSSFIESKIEYESTYQITEKSLISDISFSYNNIKQYALFSVPKSSMPQNGYPLIILIHGYINPSSYSTFNSYKYMFTRFSNSEFAVIKPDLRGHGRSEINDDFDINLAKLYYTQDILILLDAIKKEKNIDFNNIYILGHSNGGDIALRVISVKNELLKAVSLWAPVSVKLEESNFFYKGGGKRKYGLDALDKVDAKKDIEDSLKILKESLAKKDMFIDDVRYYDFLKETKTDIIIRHPDTDESVPYKWSLNFVNIFKGITGKNITIFNYPGDNHNIANHQSSAQMDDLVFFRKYLNR